MKRFTVEQDHRFEIGGEVFSWIYPYWEDIANVFDKDARLSTEEEGKNGSEVEFTVHSTIKDFIDRIKLFLPKEDHERWIALTKRKANPIPHAQYSELYRWLLEVSSSPTPTEPLSPSEDGQQPVVATSTGG